MSDRVIIVVEMGFAALWTAILFTAVPGWLPVPQGPFVETAMLAFLGPGLVLGVMVMAVGLHRFLGNDAPEGGGFHGPRAKINQRVLINSTEQTVLALAIWPAAALQLGERGPEILIAMSCSFVLARLLFWAGYHLRPALRAFGFAATFYPTMALGIWGAVRAMGA
ncbi:MAPEG family protein [Marivivens marinus]|uniref:MAPEG family protein n=1 Tax=Marivivens marinus TaxID=3110173 RepID=UPI003B846FF4